VQLAPFEQKLQDAMQDLRELEETNEQLESSVVQQAAELAKATERESVANLSYEKVMEEREALLSSHAAAMVEKARVVEEHLAAVRCVAYCHDGDSTCAHTYSLSFVPACAAVV
jgi:precorrin-2 methylase